MVTQTMVSAKVRGKIILVNGENILSLVLTILLILLVVEVELVPVGPLIVSSAEISMMVMIVLPFIIRGKENIAFLKRNSSLVALGVVFLAIGLVAAVNSPIMTSFPYKGFARYCTIIFAAWQLAFLCSEKRDTFFLIVFMLAGALSLLTIPEAYVPHLGNFLADVFREGHSTYINGRLRPSATLNQANVMACFNVAAMFMGVFLRERKAIGKWLFWMTTMVISISVSLGNSRNAFVAFLIATILIGATKQNRVLAGQLVLLFACSHLLFSPSLSRLSGIEDKSSNSRLMIWKCALEVSRDYPIFGVGPGCFNKMLPQYAPEELKQNERENLKRAAHHAHNGMLNILAEFGIVGAGVVVTMLVLFFRRFVRRCTLMPPSASYAVAYSFLGPFLLDSFLFSYSYMVIMGSVLVLLIQETPVSTTD